MPYSYDPTTGGAVLQQAPSGPGMLSGLKDLPWSDLLSNVGMGLLTSNSLGEGLGRGAMLFQQDRKEKHRQQQEDYWKQQALDLDQRRMDQQQGQFDANLGWQKELPGIEQANSLETLGVRNKYATEQEQLGHKLGLETLSAEQKNALARIGAQSAASASQARLNSGLDMANWRAQQEATAGQWSPQTYTDEAGNEGVRWTNRQGEVSYTAPGASGRAEGAPLAVDDSSVNLGSPGTRAAAPKAVQSSDFKMQLEDSRGYEQSARLVDDLRTSQQNVAKGATIGPDIRSRAQRFVTTFLGVGNVDLNTSEGQLAAQRQFESIPQSQGSWSNEERRLFSKAIANPESLTTDEYVKLLGAMEKRELQKMDIMDEYNAIPDKDKPLWSEHKITAIGKRRKTAEGNPRSGEAQPGNSTSGDAEFDAMLGLGG